MTFGFLPSIGPLELILILAIVVIIFGAGKLPGLGRAMGQSIKEFKKSVDEKEEPVQAAREEN